MANKSRPLDFIVQTNKTIIFEEFNSSADDLYTLIKNEDVNKKEEFFTLIKKKLEVRSFEEFCEKFMPSVWEWYETGEDLNNPVNFCYSLERPNGIPNAHELKLDKNEFYSMIMKLYDQKKNSGDSNLEFDYSMVSRLLSPNTVLDRAKQLRKDLDYNYQKLIELGDGSSYEKNKYIKQINNIRREIVTQYKDSFTGVIKLALADASQKLALIDSNSSSKTDGVAVLEDGMKKQPCLLGFDEKGNLDIRLIEIQDNNAEVAQLECKNDTKLLQIISDDYDKYSDQSNGNFVKNIIVNTYCTDTQVGVLPDREELVEKRNMYTALYKNSQEKFIRAISSAVEKLLNVKTFFEHAVVPKQKQINSSVIISNCTAEKLLDDTDGVKTDLISFLKEASKETKYRIWFAVVPAVGDSEFIDNVDEEITMDDDLFGDEENEAKNVKTTDGDMRISLSALKEMLAILKDARITTFFNFRANEKTGFSNLTQETLQKYRDKLESVKGNHYAVFTYPNFTVLPKKETNVKIGETEYDSVSQDERVNIPGIYIDSSYIAAGLVAASQNPDYLTAKYSKNKICPGYPCVRYDFERDNNRFIMLTKMNREGKVSWNSDVEENISKDKFGFCFCGNSKYYNGQLVNNSYIFNTRNMYVDEDGQYEPLYKRLTMDFVEHYLRIKSPSAHGNTVKKSDVQAFIKDDVAEWSINSQKDYENNILRSSGSTTESIKVESIDGNDVLKMEFYGNESEMDIEIQ